MIFQAFLLDINESNAYVVASESTREALLVDAGDYDVRIRDFISEKGLRLKGIFITHNHYDHTSGLAEFVKQYGAPVLSASGSAGDVAGTRVEHGDKIELGELTATVLSTPGHTNDSLSLAFPSLVFTGDALFAGSVGGTSTSEAARRQIEAIRQHIFTLPHDWEIYSGHGPASTVCIEKRHNPFFV